MRKRSVTRIEKCASLRLLCHNATIKCRQRWMTPCLSLWQTCWCFSSISWLTNKQSYYFKVSPYRVSPCQWNSLWIYRHRFLNPRLKLQIPSDEIRSSVVFFIAVTSENQLWDTFNVLFFFCRFIFLRGVKNWLCLQYIKSQKASLPH